MEKLSFRKQDVDLAQLTYENITRKLYLTDEEGVYSDEADEGWESEEEMDE